MSRFKINKELIEIPKIIQVDKIYIGNSEYTTQNVCKTKTGILYNNQGKLIYRGYDGTITIIANN